jgi:hypothetical protein
MKTWRVGQLGYFFFFYLLVMGLGAGCGRDDRRGDGPPPILIFDDCGNGVIDSGETCDGSDLGGESCESLGFGSGTLLCRSSCGGFDTSQCGAPESCGDGRREAPEVCDGADLGGATCQSQGFGAGELECLPNCAGFNTSLCGPAAGGGCGNRQCGTDPQSGESCGSCQQGFECNTSGQCVRETCDIPALTQNGVLDFNVETVTISGQVTVNGAAMPNNPSSNSRGWLRFYDLDNGDYVDVDLQTSGPATYSVTLFKGRYDVRLVPRNRDWQTAIPASEHVLRENVSLNQNGVLDFNVETVTISGQVTVNAASMPNNPSSNSRGWLRFYDTKSLGYVDVDLGVSGPATYSVTLFKGRYDIRLIPRSRDWQTAIPTADHVLREDVSLTQNGVLDFNAETVTINGQVTVNGASMPNNPSSNSRGWLVFYDRKSLDTAEVELGASGPATYSVTLFKGRYDVRLNPRNRDWQTAIPTVDHVLREDVSLTQNGVLDFNTETVTITGQVTVNGASMPNNSSSNSRGWLVFYDRKSLDTAEVEFAASGPATYSITLFKGRYDVRLNPRNRDWQTAIPTVDHVLREDVSLTQNGVLDFNAETVTINGQVTINGASMPNNTSSNSRAWLVFYDRKSLDTGEVEFGASGPATYSITLFKGRYDVRINPRNRDWQTALPILDHVLREDVSLTQNGVLDFNAETITLTGQVTVNGAVMGTNTLGSSARAELGFTDRRSFDAGGVELGTSGAATYSMQLFKGNYDIALWPRSRDFQNVLPRSRKLLRTACN